MAARQQAQQAAAAGKKRLESAISAAQGLKQERQQLNVRLEAGQRREADLLHEVKSLTAKSDRLEREMRAERDAKEVLAGKYASASRQETRLKRSLDDREVIEKVTRRLGFHLPVTLCVHQRQDD